MSRSMHAVFLVGLISSAAACAHAQTSEGLEQEQSDARKEITRLRQELARVKLDNVQLRAQLAELEDPRQAEAVDSPLRPEKVLRSTRGTAAGR